MNVPVWTPPLRIASRVAARSTRRRWSSSSSVSVPAGVRGFSRAARASRRRAGCRRPRSSLLVEQARLERRIVPRPTRSRKTSRETSAASGPTWAKSGSITARPSRRLSRSASRPPSAKSQREAVPAGCGSSSITIRPAIPRCSPSSGPPSVSAHRNLPRRRAFVSRWPVSARGDLAGRVRAADVGVAVVDGDDLAAQRPLDLLAGALGLWEFRHVAEATIPAACRDHAARCHAVPGSNERFIAKAVGLEADEIFLDLEDAVAPSEKDSARERVIEALRTLDFGEQDRRRARQRDRHAALLQGPDRGRRAGRASTWTRSWCRRSARPATSR